LQQAGKARRIGVQHTKRAEGDDRTRVEIAVGQSAKVDQRIVYSQLAENQQC
jgi:hypothetical protein